MEISVKQNILLLLIIYRYTGSTIPLCISSHLRSQLQYCIVILYVVVIQDSNAILQLIFDKRYIQGS